MSILERIKRQLLGRYLRKTKSTARRKHGFRRRAFLESLERREVLDAGALAAIAGTVYTDRVEDGVFEAADLPLSGITVQLYQDDGTFPNQLDTADSLIQSTTTVDGEYLFSDLTAGVYHVTVPEDQVGLTGANLLQRPSPTIHTIEISASQAAGIGTTVIDSFETFQVATDSSLDPTGTLTPQSSSRPAPEALGGERDLFVQLTDGPGEVSLKANAFGRDVLQYDSSAGARGERIVTWDGPDGSFETLDYEGLGGIDLTDNGRNDGLLLEAWADHEGGRVAVILYTDADHWSEIEVEVPERFGMDVTPDGIPVLFAEFVRSGALGGADFANIGAIQLSIVDDPTSTITSVDGLINRFSTKLGPIRADFAHIVAAPEVHLEKHTNGVDADDPFGPDVPRVSPGQAVTWTYEVSNPGNLPLENVVVTDDAGTPLITADDFLATPELDGGFIRGDANQDNRLDPGETWVFTASALALELHTTTAATVPGIDVAVPLPVYQNLAEVTATANGTTVRDEDPSHYANVPDPQVHIEKFTNGSDADDPFGNDVPQVSPGSEVVWTYRVSNPGNIPLSNVVVRDDNGTPAISADDFQASAVATGGVNQGDLDGDNLLDPGEIWEYTANATADDLMTTTHPTVPGVDVVSPLPVYQNLASVSALGNGVTVTDDDPSHYANIPLPEIRLEKHTNGADADDPFGSDVPRVLAGDQVTWMYFATNAGNVPLSNVMVRDDNGTPNVPTDDFNALAVFENGFVQGDVNQNSQLDPGEVWVFSASDVARDLRSNTLATVPGQDPADPQPVYQNRAVVTATSRGMTVQAQDISHYGNVKLASLGDFVWEDLNQNGVQDGSESGVGGVRVQLTGKGRDGVAGTADDVSESTTTGPGGFYSFANLVPGEYKVTFDLASAPVLSNDFSGWLFTSANAGQDAADSDADPTTGMTAFTTLDAGEVDLSLDAGIYRELAPRASLGDYVWFDQNYVDHNNNGIRDDGDQAQPDGVQDFDEVGVPGVTVTLTGKGLDGVLDTADDVIQTATTDGAGRYLFSELAPGEYRVTFDTTTAGAGYLFSPPNAGDDAADSDAQPLGTIGLAQTQFVTLNAGDNNLTLDAGIYTEIPEIQQLASVLGNFVWFDQNRNGIQDTGEAGVNGVTVDLLNAAGAVIDTTVTANVAGQDGAYQFDVLPPAVPGDFRVRFRNLPVGFTFTTQNAGADDALDSDVDANGLSQLITLPDGASNLTLDAGLVQILIPTKARFLASFYR